METGGAVQLPYEALQAEVQPEGWHDLQDKAISLEKWLSATWLLSNCKDGIRRRYDVPIMDPPLRLS